MTLSFVIRLSGCLSGIFAFIHGAQGNLITAAQIASVLGYPASKLVIKDVTDETNVDSGMISAYQVNSADNTFAPMVFAVAKKGVILTTEAEQEIVNSPQAREIGPSGKPLIQRIALGEDAYGFTGLGGMGPGGSEEVVLATLPSKGLDLAVKMFVSREALNVTKETEAYHHLITKGGEQLAQRLVECAKLTVAAARSLPSASAPSVKPLLVPRRYLRQRERPR